MRDERKDELDSMLDGALRDYSNREPRAGLDQRILRQVPPRRRSSWWTGWALIPASLAAIILVVTSADRGKPKVQPQPQVARLAQLPTLPPIPAIAKVAPKPAKFPKPERVPEPETVTPGERALMRFARSDPEQARELFADSGPMKDLKIDPLKIEQLP